MAFKTKKTEEEKEPSLYDTPKLSFNNMVEITQLVRKLGNTNKVLEYWGMVKLDNKDKVVAICDYQGQSEQASEKYYNYQPLIGIKYTTTLMPFTWGSEWISKWSSWLKHRYDEGDKSLEDLAYKDRKSGIKI